MLRASQFNLVSIRVAIFTPDVKQFSQSDFLVNILRTYASRFDGAIHALSLPADAPGNLPHVILQSRNKTWLLQATPARVDLTWVKPVVQQDVSDLDIVTQCSEVLMNYVQTAGERVRVGRLALVMSRACEAANPAQELIERFCNEGSKVAPFNNSRAFEVHNLKSYHPESIGKPINSWARCKTANLNPGNKRVVVFEQELNTLEEDVAQNIFDAKEIGDFFHQALAEANVILGIYFPDKD